MLDGQDARSSGAGRGVYAFHAKRAAASRAVSGDVPKIGVIWVIPTKSPKGELAWRFIVQQNGAKVAAAILGVDGDTGALTGTYRDGKFILSHFSGVRPSLLEVALLKDGTLEMLQDGKNRLTAVREDDPRAKALPEPTDPNRHTVGKDAGERFQSSYPDLSGNIVTNMDRRVAGQVVLVDLAESRFLHCQDEQPLLAC